MHSNVLCFLRPSVNPIKTNHLIKSEVVYYEQKFCKCQLLCKCNSRSDSYFEGIHLNDSGCGVCMADVDQLTFVYTVVIEFSMVPCTRSQKAHCCEMEELNRSLQSIKGLIVLWDVAREFQMHRPECVRTLMSTDIMSQLVYMRNIICGPMPSSPSSHNTIVSICILVGVYKHQTWTKY